MKTIARCLAVFGMVPLMTAKHWCPMKIMHQHVDFRTQLELSAPLGFWLLHSEAENALMEAV